MSDNPVVSVVIVTWNARDALERCLHALERHPPGVPWEAVVIDNGSGDDTCLLVEKVAPWARLIGNRENRGLPAANNQGICATTGAYVLIANPDTEVGPGAIEALVDVLERHDRAAFAIPRLRHEDGTLQTSAGDLPSLRQAVLGRRVQRQRRSSPSSTSVWWDGWAHDEERPIGRGHEACYLVRRQAIAEIGLQDESFFLDWEGFDWTDRARACGWEVWFTPRAEVVHAGGASIEQVPYRWILHSHRGMYRYFAKRRPRWQRPLLAVGIGTRAALKAMAQFAVRDLYRRTNR